MFLIDTYLDKSKIQGVGVFAKENIKKAGIFRKISSAFSYLVFGGYAD